MTFAQLLWALAALVVCAQATGTFVVLHSPENLIFKSKDNLNQSVLKDVYTATLGYTANAKPWNGLHYKDPFELPKAVVAVVVEGVDSLDVIEGKKFPLFVDESEEFTWQSLSNRLKMRDNNNFLVRINLGDGLDALGHSALGELKPNSTDEFHLKSLTLENKEDRKFLEELQMLHAIADKVRTVVKADDKSGLYWFVVSGLKPVFDIYGNNSDAAKEALSLLDETLRVVSKAFKRVYNDQILITAFTNDIQSSNIRERRDAEGSKSNEAHNENLAPKYSEDYPVIFNIILWFVVALFFSLLAICIFIAEMDPGRDSIIYRMTSNRMKKDN